MFQMYEEALEMLLPVTGELHMSICRIYLNIGIYYEDIRQYQKAYDWYWKWYILSRDLYGPDHPKTTRCKVTLNEPFYKRIARNMGREIPACEPVS